MISKTLLAIYKAFYEYYGSAPSELLVTQRQFQMLNNELKDSFRAESDPCSYTVRAAPSFNEVPVRVISEEEALMRANGNHTGLPRRAMELHGHEDGKA